MAGSIVRNTKVAKPSRNTSHDGRQGGRCFLSGPYVPGPAAVLVLHGTGEAKTAVVVKKGKAPDQTQ